MRRKRFGMLLVAHSMLLAGPVVTSMMRSGVWDFGTVRDPRRFADSLMVSNGVLAYDASDAADSIIFLPGYGFLESPFEFRWSQSAGTTEIRLPIWPVPIVTAAVGVFFWRSGARRSRADRATKSCSFVSASISFSIAAIGLALTGVVACSFLGTFRSHALNLLANDMATTTVLKFEQGGMSLQRYTDHVMSPRHHAHPSPGLFRFWWHWKDTLFVVFPFWPLAAVFLVTGVRMLVHRERRIHAALRGLCLKCGYDLETTAGRPCPECGPR